MPANQWNLKNSNFTFIVFLLDMVKFMNAMYERHTIIQQIKISLLNHLNFLRLLIITLLVVQIQKPA
jgi:hypothetical protein